jgi:hypothetical protein
MHIRIIGSQAPHLLLTSCRGPCTDPLTPANAVNSPEGRTSDPSGASRTPSPLAQTAAAAEEDYTYTGFEATLQALREEAQAKGQLEVLLILHLPGGKDRELQDKLEVDSVGFYTKTQVLHITEMKTTFGMPQTALKHLVLS